MCANFQSKWTTFNFPAKIWGNCPITCNRLKESWKKAEMSWLEVEMSWVEVDGAGWKWVHGLVIPI